MRTYKELSRLVTFEERFEYLKLSGTVGYETFGYDRYLNQLLYTSRRWRKTRDEVLIRDNGFDLGIEGFLITGKVFVHHMNPITIEDVENDKPEVYDPNFLITVSLKTHNAIHYGDSNLLSKPTIERFRNDTCPWR